MIRIVLAPGLDGMLLEKMLEVPEFDPYPEGETGVVKEDFEAAVIDHIPEEDFWKSFPRLRLLVVVGLKLPPDLEKTLLARKVDLRYSTSSNQAQITLEIITFLRDFFNV